MPLQIEETSTEGLKRVYTVTIPAADIEAQVNAEVKKVAPQVRMPGFRPGKVPANLVRKMHGEQMHGQVVNDTVKNALDDLVKEKSLRPAMQPQVNLNKDYAEGKDAVLDISMEILPAIEAPDTSGLKLEKLTVPVDDSQVNEALKNIAEQQKTYKNAPKTRKAKDGDQLVIDFTGRVDGEEFEGGKAEGSPLVIGSGQFIPGFEEQLTGAKAGDEKTIEVTFPDDYPAEHLKGKKAEFDVAVQAVKVETETKLDDEFATNMGLESMAQLKELLRGQVEQETAGLTRTAMKRSLLDKLAAGHDFDVPQGMVDAEFEQIWQQLQQEAQKDADPEAAMKEIESEKDDYRSIAERRVRLGLLLSEIGQKNNVQITAQEMSQLIQQAAQQYREEDRQRFVEYVQNEPLAAAQLRAPLYEDKVVDHLFEQAEVTEREVTREELQAAIEADEEAEIEAAKAVKPKTPAAKKKAAGKGDKAAAKTGLAKKDSDKGKPASPKAPAKKAATKKASAEKDDAIPPSAKKAPSKKAAPKKAAPKKAAEKKAPVKKAPAKKPAAKKAPAKK